MGSGSEGASVGLYWTSWFLELLHRGCEVSDVAVVIAVVAVATTVASLATAVVVVADALVSVTGALESRIIPVPWHALEMDPLWLSLRIQTSEVPFPTHEVVAAMTNAQSVGSSAEPPLPSQR